VIVCEKLGGFGACAAKNACVLAAEAARNSGVGISDWLLALPRTRIHSGLAKKKSLSLMTGPPRANPNWLRVYLPLGMPLCAFVTVFDVYAESRLYNHAPP
jgi:hypothetical protein